MTLAVTVQPTAGLASAVAGKARYRGGAGFSGPDRFTVEVASPSGKRSLAPIILLVGPRTAAPGYDAIPAPAGAPINVSNGAGLAAALAGAVPPGSHVVLGSGAYNPPSGDSGWTFSKAGADGRPIIVRAATFGGPVLNGSLTSTGAHVRIHGLDVRGVASLSGLRSRLVRVKVTAAPGANSGIVKVQSGHDQVVFACDVTGDGVCIEVQAGAAGSVRRPVIKRCFIHDVTGPKGNGYEGVQVGQSHGSRLDAIAAWIAENYFYNLAREAENISFKSSYNTAIQNVFDRCRSITNRQATFSRMLGNLFRNSLGGDDGLHVFDNDSELNGNVGPVRLLSGSMQDGEGRIANRITRSNASRTLIVGHRGAVHVGTPPGDEPLNYRTRATVIRAHAGGAITYESAADQAQTTVHAALAAGQSIVPTLDLSAANTGLNAPLAP